MSIVVKNGGDQRLYDKNSFFFYKNDGTVVIGRERKVVFDIKDSY